MVAPGEEQTLEPAPTAAPMEAETLEAATTLESAGVRTAADPTRACGSSALAATAPAPAARGQSQAGAQPWRSRSVRHDASRAARPVLAYVGLSYYVAANVAGAWRWTKSEQPSCITSESYC